MAAFSFDSYDPTANIGTILQLMQAGPRARADAMRQGAAAQARAQEIGAQNTANMVGTIGQLASGVGSQVAQHYSPEAQFQRESAAALADERRARAEEIRRKATEADATKQRHAALTQALTDSHIQDPETGVFTYDTNKAMQSLSALGANPEELQQFLPILDKATASVKAAVQSNRDALKDRAAFVNMTGNDPAVFESEIQLALKNRLINERDAAQYLARVRSGGTAAVSQITASILGRPPAKLEERDPTKDLYRPETGEVVMKGTPKPEPQSFQSVKALVDGKAALVNFDSNTGRYRLGAEDVTDRVRPIPTEGEQQGAKPYFTYQPVFDAQGRPISAIRFDARGGPPAVIDVASLSGGGQLKGPPGDTGKSTIVNEAAEDQLDRLVAMFNNGQKANVGPVEGRARALGQSLPLVPSDPAYSDFAAASSAFKNAVIKAITGAQMSEPEAKRLMQQIPSVTDKPVDWLAKAQQTKQNLQDLKNRVIAPRAPAGRGGTPAPTAKPTPKADPLGIR